MLDVGAELLQLSKQAPASGGGKGADVAGGTQGGGTSSVPGSGGSKVPSAVDPGSFLAVVGRSTGKWVQDGSSRVLLDDQWATNQSTTFLTAGKPGPAPRSHSECTRLLLVGNQGCFDDRRMLLGLPRIGCLCGAHLGRRRWCCQGRQPSLMPTCSRRGVHPRRARRAHHLACHAHCRVRDHRQQSGLHHLLPGHQPGCAAGVGLPEEGGAAGSKSPYLRLSLVAGGRA